MCPGRSVLKIAPHCGSRLRDFSKGRISSATISFQSWQTFLWLQTCNGGRSQAPFSPFGSLFHRRKVSLGNSAWRQWSMKRLMAFQENKVCLNHLSRITPSSFVEKSVFHCLSYLCYIKKTPFIQLAAQWSRPTSARHSLCPSPCLLALGLQHE